MIMQIPNRNTSSEGQTTNNPTAEQGIVQLECSERSQNNSFDQFFSDSEVGKYDMDEECLSTEANIDNNSHLGKEDKRILTFQHFTRRIKKVHRDKNPNKRTMYLRDTKSVFKVGIFPYYSPIGQIRLFENCWKIDLSSLGASCVDEPGLYSSFGDQSLTKHIGLFW